MQDKDHSHKYQALIQKLYQEKERIHASIHELLDEAMRDSLSELSLADNHPADIGTELYMRERDMAQRDRLMSREKAIDAALELWEKGRYGKCERCGKNISPERLEAIPYTTVCTQCSHLEETEEHHTMKVAPVENELLYPPYGERAGNRLHGEFDREDAWQAVARYGTSDSLQDLGTNQDISDPNELYENSDETIGGAEAVELIPVKGNSQGTGEIYFSTDHED